MTDSTGRFPGDSDPPLQFNAECPDQPTPLEAEAMARLSHGMLMKLNRTIEGEIVPRLMMAFDSGNQALAEQRSANEPIVTDIEEFVRLLLTHDAYVAGRYVAEVRARGAALPAIYLDLLAPAARRLGEMWEEDECSFTDVTLGLCRMHQVLIEFSRCFEPTENHPEQARHALIVPVPGEQHTFGLFMIIEFLRRAGWHCWTGTPATNFELNNLAAEEHFELIGLSLSSEDALAGLPNEIAELRKRSRNRDVAVVVGGWLFKDRPELAVEIGADAAVGDGADLIEIVEQLCPPNQTSAD